MSEEKSNGWEKWSEKVLGDLKEFNSNIKEIQKEITELKIEMAVIKTKATIIGAIAGSVFAGLISLVAKLLSG